jgi:universal stress protein E
MCGFAAIDDDVRMNRINHILVVVDPSAGRRQSAVDKAAFLAGRLEASVELLICDVESARDDHAMALHAHQSHPSNTQLLDLLDELAAPLRADGLNVTLRVIYGRLLHESLLDYFRGSNADLIVKDTHHHTLARRTWMRNTDWHLAQGCPAPLLLTKSKEWGRPPVIMAAIDPSLAGESAALDHRILNCAALLTGRMAGDLHVIHTYVPTALAAAVAGGKSRMTREYSEALQVEHSFRCCQMEHLVGAYGVTPQRLHVEMGTPGDCLTGSVKKLQTDLMIMGASSHGWLRRIVSGSTASAALESLPCDILVVKPSDGGPD